MRPPASTYSLDVYTAGSRFLAARSTRRLCSLRNMALGSTVRAPARARHVREGPGEFVRTLRLNELRLRPQRSRRDVCCFQHVVCYMFAECPWLPEDSNPIDPRNGLLEQFQTLAD